MRTSTDISNQHANTAETDLIEVYSEEEGDSDEEKDDTEEVLNQFKDAMDSFKEKILHVYESKLKKGVKYFTKKLRQFSKQKNATLESTLFTIGKEANNIKSSGKRKKIGKLIPVQVTAKSRREYKHRGRVAGVSGRRVRDVERRHQMVITETSENVYHTLPKQKKQKQKQAHSLKEAVDMNRPGSKKH